MNESPPATRRAPSAKTPVLMIGRLQLKNWRNFLQADIHCGERVFLVGPNASGKSNLLDALRFLRDIVKDGGGLQYAITGNRKGLSSLRCLAARRAPTIEIAVELVNEPGGPLVWRYELGIDQRKTEPKKPVIIFERVWRGENLILDRPDAKDRADPIRLTQTHLEQLNSNADFREIADFLGTIEYSHLVPQLIRHAREYSGPGIPDDPYGRDFLRTLASLSEKKRRSRLKNIENALVKAVPQLSKLDFSIDDKEGGVPHLQVVYRHWRPRGARQREYDLSDGTLRLIGLFWALLEKGGPLLLEEPELSLHPAIIRRLAGLMSCLQHRSGRQIFVSTHSPDLLSDHGIGGGETFILEPAREGTEVKKASDLAEVRALLEAGFSVGEAVIPKTEPPELHQLTFDDLLKP